MIYAVVSLRKFAFTVSRQNEKWIGGGVGLISGAIAAATGVQVVPSMPYLQAVGMEKDEFVQALGVFFTIGTLALACALAGMAIGQAVRARLAPETFRRWFLISMICLGTYLAITGVYEISFA